MMKEIYHKAFKGGHAKNGFETSGLFPLNRNKITEEKLRLGKKFYQFNPIIETES